ncbi:MAG: F0F1 ATP synthase subunit gamma [Spirochaetota bacterium]
MASKQALERRISSTEDMSSIVSTMKSLAAVNVRLFETARRSLEAQVDVLERGFQVALAGGAGPGGPDLGRRDEEGGGALYLVFGSVQGMCGQFNDHLARYVDREIQRQEKGPAILVIGDRIAGSLSAMGYYAHETLPAKSSIDGVTELISELLHRIEAFRADGPRRIFLFHNEVATRVSHRPTHRQILPLDEVWLAILRREVWPGPTIPQAITSTPRLLEELVSNYLFSVIYLGALESLAGENAARLSSMQAAEKNIEEQLEDLHREHNRRRQAEITEELLDIVGGYTALGG